MCESCILKQGQQTDFKCAVCLSPAQPTINAKDPNRKRVGTIRDYYELNHHVMGETQSLGYYRRYSVESVNNSLLMCSVNNTSEIVLETKCSECGCVAARVECKQCNAFYCKCCFETVHSHSRVLKSHIFQCLDDDKSHPEKGICVGKEIFHMPLRLICHAHNAPANIYCTKCQRNCCEQCSVKYHGNHKKCLVAEMNQRYVAEVPATIQSLEAGLLQIKNAQMVSNRK
ncbi:uncharacterized protein LOC122322530 [Drosophila grimshawi]|uniref:uncharacterized protein LOC122322530 n=1 Tax=Drosophila grimshawi TaxID=7222 RepID=UPI001C934DFE|nr:uncharacterized protein LOC122322530 [Drosophila grimshawi]